MPRYTRTVAAILVVAACLTWPITNYLDHRAARDLLDRKSWTPASTDEFQATIERARDFHPFANPFTGYNDFNQVLLTFVLCAGLGFLGWAGVSYIRRRSS